MVDIEGFAAQRGWNDQTLIALLVRYLEDSNNVEGALQYLNGVAEVEDELSEEDEWGADEDEEEDADG